MSIPSQAGYKNLDNALPEKQGRSWPDIAENFLTKYFEGHSFSIWFFVSGFLIVIYGKYAVFEKSVPFADSLKLASLFFLFLLILLTFIKNIIFILPMDLQNKLRTVVKLSKTYKRSRWLAMTLGSEGKKLDLPVSLNNFKRIYSRVKVLEPGDGRWRAGFIFNGTGNKREYIFHAYQDSGDSAFRTRIVERIPGVKEIPGDINKTIGIENSRNFAFWIEFEKNNLVFYVENIIVGKYKVPLSDVDNVQLGSWSDNKPIKILFEDIQVET